MSAVLPQFLIGVTGHMDLKPTGDDWHELRSRIRCLFDFLKKGRGQTKGRTSVRC